MPKKDRPIILEGNTYKIKTGCGNLYVTVNRDSEGKPYEILLKTGKNGGCISSHMESIGRLSSLALQKDIELEKLIKHMEGIRCASPTEDEKYGKVYSCSDAIAKILKISLKET